MGSFLSRDDWDHLNTSLLSITVGLAVSCKVDMDTNFNVVV